MADLALTLDGTNPIFTPNRIKARNQHELVDQINKINNIMINVDANTFNTTIPKSRKQVKRKSAWSTVASVLQP